MLQCKTKWKKKKLGKLGYTYSGLSNKTIDDFGSGEDFIPYMNIYKNSIIKTDKFEQVKIGLNEHQNQVQCGDVFFTTSSETPDEVGLTSVLIDKIEKPLYLNSFCFGFRLNDNNEFDNKFLAYLLRGENVRFQISKMAQGSTRYNLSKTQLLEKLKLYYPEDKKEQSRIANILLGCDKVIEKTEETIEKYKQIKAGMMQDLFTRGLDTNGKLRPTYAQTPDLYKYSEELDRYIPKDWDIKKLNEIGNIVTGSTPSTQNLSYYGDEYMFVSPADIDEDRYIKTTLKNLSLKGFNISRKIPANSVCVVCIGSTIGKEAISEKECTTNQQINTIIPFNSNFSLYYYYSTCLYLKKQFDANVGLQAVPIVNKSNFEEFYIPEPKDEKEVVKIQSIVNQFDEKIEKEEQYLNKYKQIKQGLMKRLLTPPADAEIVEE